MLKINVKTGYGNVTLSDEVKERVAQLVLNKIEVDVRVDQLGGTAKIDCIRTNGFENIDLAEKVQDDFILPVKRSDNCLTAEQRKELTGMINDYVEKVNSESIIKIKVGNANIAELDIPEE